MGFYFVVINVKGGKCWTLCYGVGIDVEEGQYDQCWTWFYDVVIDAKRGSQCWTWCYDGVFDVKRGQYGYNLQWIK